MRKAAESLEMLDRTKFGLFVVVAHWQSVVDVGTSVGFSWDILKEGGHFEILEVKVNVGCKK